MIKRILNEVADLGACRKTEGITTARQLAALYFSPQGREFCIKHNYPTLARWKEIKARIPNLEEMGFYIDAGEIKLHNKESVALVGQTRAVAKLDKNNSVFHILVLHEASASVEASNYSVFEVETDNTGQVTINKDITAIHL